MSETAQEQTSISTTPPPDALAGSPSAAAQSEPEAQAQARSNQRKYTLFEEARTDTWTRLSEAEADSPDAALETLGEQKLKEPKRFMAIPSRFVIPKKPKVDTVTTISFD